MATCLRALPLNSFLPSSIPNSQSVKNRNLRINKCSYTGARNSANIPMPPLNPKDPFLSRLAYVAANSPESLLERPSSSDTPPYLDIFDSPKMAYPTHVERSVSYRGRRPRRPPPDLPSLLLDGRIVFIGMPFVSAVSELIIAQIMYLQYMDDKEPIYLYINSTGTTRDDGEIVGLESEGFAIYDAMMMARNEVHTVAIGAAVGQACLLLAAGTKGKRYMMPHAKALIKQPKVPSTGLMSASDIFIRAKEAVTNKDTLVELLAKHTEKPVETVARKMSRPFYMDAMKAKAFGVIDKVLWRGQEELMSRAIPPEEWSKLAGINLPDPF